MSGLPTLLLLSGLGCVESGVTVHNTLPALVLTAPLDGAVFLEREPFAVQAYVHDSETANEHLLYLWGLSPDGQLSGTQTIDDNGVTLALDDGLPPGDWTLKLTVVDPRGGATEGTLAVSVATNAAPTVALVSPLQDQRVYEEDSVEVVVTLTDDEDPAGLALAWSGPAADRLASAPAHPDSDGTARFYLVDLAPGDVQLAVTATDRLGLTDTATVLFEVFTGDQDGDGWVDQAVGGDDCDDADPDVHPGATEVVDGVDNDCDGLMDNTGEWHTTVLDSSGTGGRLLAMALDDDEDPHFAWYDDGDLVAATLGDFGWALEILATGQLSTLELAWQDGLHLLWTDDATDSLHYGVHDGTNLESTPVDGDLGVVSLAYDAQGHGTFVLDADADAHVVWTDGASEQVSYAWGDTAGFVTVRASDRPATALAVALDPVGGGVGVAIYDPFSAELLFSYMDTDGQWTTSVVDNLGEPGEDVRLVFDSAGTPHLVWWDDVDNRVRYGWWSGLAWILSDLADSELTSDRVGVAGLSLAVDASDGLHAAWAWSFEQSASTTVYEAGYASDADDWATTNLAAEGASPVNLVMVLDGLAEPHLAWRDGETGEVVYRFRY